MRRIEMDTWTIFDHNEEALADWAFYHEIDPYPVKEFNRCMLEDVVQSIRCFHEIFRPSGFIRLGYALPLRHLSNKESFYNGEFNKNLITLKLDTDCKSDDIKRILTTAIEQIGGFNSIYLSLMEIYGKLRVQTSTSKTIIEYPKKIIKEDDSPVILKLRPANDRNPGERTPDSIMILVKIWTDVFMYETNAIRGKVDNSKMARINSPRLTNALTGLEKELNAQISWWEGWYPDIIEKYGFKKP